MEYSIDIFIKDSDRNMLGLSEIFVHWGDEWFSQDPKQYSFDSTLIFEKHREINFFKRYYDIFMSDDSSIENYAGFKLLGDFELITNLEWLINKKQPELTDHP